MVGRVTAHEKPPPPGSRSCVFRAGRGVLVSARGECRRLPGARVARLPCSSRCFCGAAGRGGSTVPVHGVRVRRFGGAAAGD